MGLAWPELNIVFLCLNVQSSSLSALYTMGLYSSSAAFGMHKIQTCYIILYTVLFTARVSNNTGLSESASSFYNIEILKNENIKSQREKLHPDFYFHWLKTDQFTVDGSSFAFAQYRVMNGQLQTVTSDINLTTHRVQVVSKSSALYPQSHQNPFL